MNRDQVHDKLTPILDQPPDAFNMDARFQAMNLPAAIHQAR